MITKYLKKSLLAVVSFFAFPFKDSVACKPPGCIAIMAPQPTWGIFLALGSYLLVWLSTFILFPFTIIYGIVWHIKNKEKRKKLGYPWYKFFTTKVFIILAIIMVLSWGVYFFYGVIS